MDAPGVVTVRLTPADRPLTRADLPAPVQDAIDAYIVAAEAFTPGEESTAAVELPQLAIARALLRALGLPTLQDLFDCVLPRERRREPLKVGPTVRQGTKHA